MDTPQIDVVRGLPGVELRATGDTAMPTLFGHFSRFNEWYEIRSYWEGDFVERFAPGAFAESFRMHWDEGDSHKTKVQFQHGYDYSVGERLLGKLSELREDGIGGYYEAPLFDTTYNRELVPGLEAGEYGASFRFRVTSESWDMEPAISEHNPHALPERTITGALVFEVGPVAFGASPNATAGVRSMTDDYYERLRDREPSLYADACRAAGKPTEADVAGAWNRSARRQNGGTGRRATRTELKALPDVILSTTRGIDLEAITCRRRNQELIEARRLTPNLRVTQGDDAVEISGYVAVYDEPRQVGGEAGWTEIWAPGACKRSVDRGPDVRLTLNGEGEPLARSKAGTLELTSDDYGLRITAKIDPSTPAGEDISLAVQRNEPVDALVGLDVTKQRWNDDHTHRSVEEIYLHDIALLIDGCTPRADADLARLHVEPEPEERVSLDYLLMVNATLEA